MIGSPIYISNDFGKAYIRSFSFNSYENPRDGLCYANGVLEFSKFDLTGLLINEPYHLTSREIALRERHLVTPNLFYSTSLKVKKLVNERDDLFRFLHHSCYDHVYGNNYIYDQGKLCYHRFNGQCGHEWSIIFTPAQRIDASLAELFREMIISIPHENDFYSHAYVDHF